MDGLVSIARDALNVSGRKLTPVCHFLGGIFPCATSPCRLHLRHFTCRHTHCPCPKPATSCPAPALGPPSFTDQAPSLPPAAPHPPVSAQVRPLLASRVFLSSVDPSGSLYVLPAPPGCLDPHIRVWLCV